MNHAFKPEVRCTSHNAQAAAALHNEGDPDEAIKVRASDSQMAHLLHSCTGNGSVCKQGVCVRERKQRKGQRVRVHMCRAVSDSVLDVQLPVWSEPAVSMIACKICLSAGFALCCATPHDVTLHYRCTGKRVRRGVWPLTQQHWVTQWGCAQTSGCECLSWAPVRFTGACCCPAVLPATLGSSQELPRQSNFPAAACRSLAFASSHMSAESS